MSRYDQHSGEETAMWNTASGHLKALTAIHTSADTASRQITKLKRSLPQLDDEQRIYEVVDKLERYSKEFANALDEERALIEQAQESLELLIALRQATEAGTGSVEDNRRKKRKLLEVDNANESTRSKKPRNTLEHFQVGAAVAFRQPKTKHSDGDWIQCNIIRLLGGEGPKLRCEVQDPEPDENGAPGQTYKTTIGQLILVPKENAGLPAHPRGAHVLARYPETTTFYRAEVVTSKREYCYLRFEGEEEFGKETEVERRLVLEVPKS